MRKKRLIFELQETDDFEAAEQIVISGLEEVLPKAGNPPHAVAIFQEHLKRIQAVKAEKRKTEGNQG